MLTQEKIDGVFRGECIGREILYFESVPSTNDQAVELGKVRTNPDGLVVVADMQTHGRGRLGRTWISPKGVNLYITILLSLSVPAGEASLFSLSSAVAAARAIQRETGLNAQIKWPNDIQLDGKKTGGILLEAKTMENGRTVLAAGIGLNVNMSEEAFPPDIRGRSTSLKLETGKKVDRAGLLGKLLSEFERTHKVILSGQKKALMNEWLSLNSTIGQSVSVQCAGRTITGKAERINDSGELILRLESGEARTVRAGDVSIIKEAGAELDKGGT